MQGMSEQQKAVLQQVVIKAQEVVEDLFSAQVGSTETWTLKEKEAAVMAGISAIGKELLSGLLRLHETPYVADTVPCQCGGEAKYQRRREGGTQTLVGEVRVKRAYYLCPDCHRGRYPLDEELEFSAGGLSAGLEECAALAGVVEPFASAAELLRRLLWTGAELSHNRIRVATEAMGHTLARADDELVERGFNGERVELPQSPKEGPKRIYVSVDGTCVRCKATEEEGAEARIDDSADPESQGYVWREAKVAALYETEEVSTEQNPEKVVIKAKEIEYHADISDAVHFAGLVWLKAYERGASHAEEVVLLGDGAQWIWVRLGMLFPQAIQILDWYHAQDYLKRVTQAVFGPGTKPGVMWQKREVDLLWDGKVQQVIQDLETLQQEHPQIETIQEAITYYMNNQHRMDYPAYRERGLQIGSGTIESGCKRVVKARLDQAGMTWTVKGARAVLKARAGYLSGRWDDFWSHRPFVPRAYRRGHAQVTRLAA